MYYPRIDKIHIHTVYTIVPKITQKFHLISSPLLRRMFRNFLTHRSFPSTRSIPPGLHLYFSSPLLSPPFSAFSLFDHSVSLHQLNYLLSRSSSFRTARYFSVNRLFHVVIFPLQLPFFRRTDSIALSTNRSFSLSETRRSPIRFYLQTREKICD